MEEETSNYTLQNNTQIYPSEDHFLQITIQLILATMVLAHAL